MSDGSWWTLGRFKGSLCSCLSILLGIPSHIDVDLLLPVAHPYELTFLGPARWNTIARFIFEEFRLFLGPLLFFARPRCGAFPFPLLVVCLFVFGHRLSPSEELAIRSCLEEASHFCLKAVAVLLIGIFAVLDKVDVDDLVKQKDAAQFF